MCNSAWRAAWDAGWAAALHSLLLGRPGRLRSIGWSCSPPAPPPLPSWLAKDPIVEAKVELQLLVGAGDGPMCRLAGGWPTQLCGCRVQPARRCPSKQAARWCHGYNSRRYALLCVRITKDSNSRVRQWSMVVCLDATREPLRAQATNEVHGRWNRSRKPCRNVSGLDGDDVLGASWRRRRCGFYHPPQWPVLQGGD